MAKILLVEDDNNLREIYEARLQAEGYEIVSAADGEAALAVAKQSQPDLVISDVMMPRISGFEMLDILRNTDGLKNVKVIMLTALGQAEDKSRADKLGADRYLVKSQVTLEDIVKAAADLLGGGESTAAAPATATPTPASVPAPTVAPSMPVMPAPAPPVLPTPVASPVPTPTLPAPAAIPAPPTLAPVSPTPAPAAPPAAPAAPAPSSDQVMADAVKDLMADTPVPTPPQAPPASTPAPAAPAPMPTPEPPAPAPSPTPTPPAPAATQIPVLQAPPAPVPPVPMPTPAPAPPTPPVDDNTPGSKKIIKPLDPNTTAAPPDLNALLAKEGITDFDHEGTTAPSSTNAPHPPGQVISPNPVNADGKPVDPNSISL